MELHQLRSFVAIAEEENMTRAAERLFLSQSAVSGHLRALEEELGVPLFLRTAKGMTLTPEGQRLLARARSILDSANALLSEARTLGGTLHGTLKIGFNTDPAFLRVALLSTRMRQHHPEVELNLVQAMTFEVLDAVAKGTMDGGFVYGTTGSNPALTGHELARVPLSIVAPARWRTRIESADMRGIADMPWIWVPPACPFHSLLDSHFASLGLTLRRVVETDHEDILRALVIAGEGLSVLRRCEAEELERLGHVAVWRGAEMDIPLTFACKTARGDEPLMQAILSVVQAVWADSSPTVDGDWTHPRPHYKQ